MKALAKQKGISLIELMLAVVLGLLVIGSFLQLMVNNSRSSYFHEDLALAQGNGRHTMFILSRAMRMAGYTHETNRIVMPFFIGSCSGATICTNDGGGTDSDQVAVQYLPQSGEDCAGNIVPAGELTADVFYVDDDPASDNISTLFCRGFNPADSTARGAARALVVGVERLQIVYGVSSSSSENIDQYIAASGISNWQDVRSIRVGALVNSGQQARSFDHRSRVFNILESGDLTLNDGRPRYVYTTASKLNNTGF